MVILGARGDLSRRKLLPALYLLAADGLLDEGFSVLGVARDDLDDASFRATVRKGLEEPGGEAGPIDEEVWKRLEACLFYLKGDLGDPGAYAAALRRVEEREKARPSPGGRLVYLAVPPSLYVPVIAQLSASGLAPNVPEPQEPRWVRVIVEKPFGRSLATARELNRAVRASLSEHQVYRIDHYLGKETVQNLLVFRFANSIFEPVWNRRHVHHVQITAAESVGIGTRAGYYEEAGVVRDMFQNHLLQLLTLVAMEPPVTFSADAVRDEKVKVLRSLRKVACDQTVTGQYRAGAIGDILSIVVQENNSASKDNNTKTSKSTALDASMRSARLRANAIAATPVLRTAIDTNAATMKDLADREYAFSVAAGETLEIFQTRNGKTTSLLRVPESALATEPLTGTATRVEAAGKQIAIVAGAPINSTSRITGSLTVTTRIDLAPATRQLADHAVDASLRGRSLDLPLVDPRNAPRGVPRTIPLATTGELAASGLTLVATPPAITTPWIPPARYAAIALAALLLAVYLFALWRSRRASTALTR